MSFGTPVWDKLAGAAAKAAARGDWQQARELQLASWQARLDAYEASAAEEKARNWGGGREQER
jgi:hypothetical protein